MYFLIDVIGKRSNQRPKLRLDISLLLQPTSSLLVLPIRKLQISFIERHLLVLDKVPTYEQIASNSDRYRICEFSMPYTYHLLLYYYLPNEAAYVLIAGSSLATDKLHLSL